MSAGAYTVLVPAVYVATKRHAEIIMIIQIIVKQCDGAWNGFVVTSSRAAAEIGLAAVQAKYTCGALDDYLGAYKGDECIVLSSLWLEQIEGLGGREASECAVAASCLTWQL